MNDLTQPYILYVTLLTQLVKLCRSLQNFHHNTNKVRVESQCPQYQTSERFRVQILHKHVRSLVK